MSTSIRPLIVSLAGFLWACPSSSPEAPSAAPETAPSSTFAWADVRPASEARPEEYPARLVWTSDSEAVVVAPLAGRVVSLAVKPGDSIEKGAEVARVVMPELDAAIAVARAAEQSLSVLKQREERLSALQKDGLVRASQLTDLRLEIAKHQADRLTARAVILAAGTGRGGTVALKSPMNGVVTDVGAIVGQLRRPEDGPIAHIRSRSGQRIESTLPSAPPASSSFALRTTEGELALTLINTAPTQTGVGVRAWLQASGGEALPSSAEGRLLLRLPEHGNSWLVPAAAVGSQDSERYIVCRNQGSSETRRVTVSIDRITHTDALVRADIKAGDRVALEPEAALSGLKAETQP